MPRNPSAKQQAASAANLQGNYGPKTPEGKVASAKNGQKNTGAKTTKAKARILNARWDQGIQGTLYDLSGCLHCQKSCPGKSFSRTVPFSDYAHQCLYEVIQEYPAECFYYVHGLCGVNYDRAGLPRDYCIMNDPQLRSFSQEIHLRDRNAEELQYRKKFVSLKTELEKYLTILTSEDQHFTPRSSYVRKKLSGIFKSYRCCSFTGKKFHDLDGRIQSLIFMSDL